MQSGMYLPYLGVGQAFAQPANPIPVEPAAAATTIGGLSPAPTLAIPEELASPSDAEARGHLEMLQLPVGSAAPTQSAWCSVSNLVAVALAPEAGSSTAQILILEPSNPEDCTALELPMAGPGDYIASLEWSWPGQRRALLSTTASGRVVVWTQPLQQAAEVISPPNQGQDDAVLPRCIDDWHGQLLHELPKPPAQGLNGPGAGGGAITASTAADHKAEQPLGSRQSASGLPYGAGGGTADPQQQQQQQQQPQSQSQSQQRWMQPALASVCWLRQPPGGRSWSTSFLAMKRLDPGYDCRTPGGAGGGATAGAPENFDTLFSEEAVVAGCVPHWARPHQLTAAVMSADGSLTFLWSAASKLPNTLSWHRSKPVRIPTPPEAAAGANAGSDAAAATAGDAGGGAEWRIAGGFICALHDGSLAVAVVYGRRREAVYLYGMHGNPTLSGQPVSQPGASGAGSAAAATATAGGATATAVTGSREAPQPTVAPLARLAMPQGLSVRQCAIHVSGTAAKRAFVLAQAAPRQPPPHHHHHHHHHSGGAGNAGRELPWELEQQRQLQQQPAAVICFAEVSEDGGGSGSGQKGAIGSWRMERVSAHLEPRSGGSGGGAAAAGDGDSGGAAAAAAAAAAVAPAVGPSLGLSCEGSKLVVTCGAVAYSLDSETLAVLAAQDLGQVCASESAALGSGSAAGRLYGSLYGNGHAADAAPAALLPPPPVLAATACLSANSCCLCAVARLGQRPAAGSTAAHSTEAGDAAADADAVGDVDADDLAMGDDAGDDAAGGVVLFICTVPDVVPPPTSAAMACGGGGPGSLERIEDIIACNMDTMRLAWGLLNRLSLWDVAERLRCAWLSGRHDHVARSLDQLDGLMYGHEEWQLRGALAAGVSRAKLAVLRRIPHPQAAVLAADLLAAARIVQYSQTINHLLHQQLDSLNSEETRSVVAHMIWFVVESQTLMLAGLRQWAEATEKRGQLGAPDGDVGNGGGAAAAAAGGAGGGLDSPDMLPLVRLFPDYMLNKHVQLVLAGPVPAAPGAKQGGEGRSVLAMHPAIQELLGGADVTSRVRTVPLLCHHLNRAAMKILNGHMQALHQQQQGGGGGGPGAGPGGASLPGQVPGAAVVPVTAADVEGVAKSGDMPRALMHRTMQSTFCGPFHLHYSRCKGLVTAAAIAQCFRQEEMSRILPLISLPREVLLERYRALGLQQQLMDRRQAPHVAARNMWMSFRARAPPPELHSHILTQQVSSRQRQRWRRQRAAALALGASAPLWAHVQGARVDCLTGVPLAPGTSWSLEGAEAVGAMTAQMGPGVGAAASRRNLPPLLSAIQRAWVCCAAPAELGSSWKRARLGLEQDMEY